jgi:hypothetical protein
MLNLAERIFAFETGELDDAEIVSLFAELVRTGLAWQLQGSYGRTAASLINQGIISETGEVLFYEQVEGR